MRISAEITDSHTVLVGMSGGVDSSVAAWLLKEKGWKVTGATLKLFEESEALNHPDYAAESGKKGLNLAENVGVTRSCCSLEDVEEARLAAWQMGMEHYVFNVKNEFLRDVVVPFSEAYYAGFTPNPCVECNRHVRFDKLLQRADALGIEKIATGHYARVEYDPHTDRWLLYRAKDLRKDQTYMLYGLSQRVLARCVFPIYGYEKSEIRDFAQKAGLKSAKKPDSQDICFVQNGDYASFLESFTNRKMECGDFVNCQGEFLGNHQGLCRYTIGQRKGLGLAFGKPMYVVGKDAAKNQVKLGSLEQLTSRGLMATSANWIANVNTIATKNCRISAKIRHGIKEFGAILTITGENTFTLEFENPQISVSPGQSAVLYQDNLVIGGGIIVEALK